MGDSDGTVSFEQEDTLTCPPLEIEDGFIVQHEQRPPNVGTPIKYYKNHLNQLFKGVGEVR